MSVQDLFKEEPLLPSVEWWKDEPWTPMPEPPEPPGAKIPPHIWNAIEKNAHEAAANRSYMVFQAFPDQELVWVTGVSAFYGGARYFAVLALTIYDVVKMTAQDVEEIIYALMDRIDPIRVILRRATRDPETPEELL